MKTYYLAGDRGLVGTNYKKLIGNCKGDNTSTLNLMKYDDINKKLKTVAPTHVIINAASAGGLLDDIDNGFSLMTDNMMIQNNVLKACAENDINRVLLQGSACMFSSDSDQPFSEESLENDMSLPDEIYAPTAIPKLFGMLQCSIHNKTIGSNWKTAINTNLFGPGDRIGEYSHVVGALMYKFIMAIKNEMSYVEIWGDGSQTRDILFITDAITAMDIIINNDKYDVVNVASGTSISIKELSYMIKKISNFRGSISFNENKPTGIMKRELDISRLTELGWSPKVNLVDALEETFDWYMNETR